MQLLTNDGQVVTEDTFLNAFASASLSTPFETAKVIVDQYRKFLPEDEIRALQRLANQAITTYIEG